MALVLSCHFPLCHFRIGVGIIGIVVTEGGRWRRRAKALSGCFWVGSSRRKGGGGHALAFRGGSISTPLATGREGGGGGGRAAAFWGARHPRNSRVGEWQWACCGIVRLSFLRWRWRDGGGGGGRDGGVLRALRGEGILGSADAHCRV